MRRRARANGEGSVRHDKRRGRWVATITVGWESTVNEAGDVSVRQVRRSVTGKMALEVLTRLREAQRLTDEGLITRNVAALAGAVRVEQPEGRTMTREQARTFLDHIRGDRLEAMYVVALSLGLCVSELLALGWDDVNLDPPAGVTPTVTIRRGLKRSHRRQLYELQLLP